MSGATGVLAGAAIGGLAVSAVGISQQSKANKATNAANQESLAAADQSAWNSYLLSRGVYANNAPTGTIPTGAPAVNTKLPLWANVNVPASPRWVKKGAITPSPWTMNPASPGTAPGYGMTTPASTAPQGAGGYGAPVGAPGGGFGGGYSMTNAFQNNTRQAMGQDIAPDPTTWRLAGGN